MTGEMKLSLIERFLSAFLFFAFSIASIIWFSLSAFYSVLGVINSDPILYFNKGAMYMLGVSIGGISLSIGVAYHSIFLQKVPEKVEKALVTGAAIGVLVMIILPQVAHFGVSRIMHGRQYIECQKAEYRWLLYKKFVYTKNQDVCQNLVAEITKRSRGR
ncbi:MAG: hypothetical protein NVV73_00725 [Cellvibrionaceae bacterium]|nr:hypothetical protein [Cellvibrionaceae bacterium]